MLLLHNIDSKPTTINRCTLRAKSPSILTHDRFIYLYFFFPANTLSPICRLREGANDLPQSRWPSPIAKMCE